MKVVRLIAMGVVVLVVLGVVATQYLFGPELVPPDSRYVIDRAGLPELARSVEGDLPLRVDHQVVAMVAMPRGAIFAGDPLEPHRMLHGAYQVVYPDGHLLIDAAFGESFYDEGMSEEGNRYDSDSFERVKAAMETARAIVLTHEHGDHIEGLAQVDDPASLAPRVVMNAAQHGNDATKELLPEALLDRIDPIPGASPYVVAPGVVLIPAAGHTPGSQLVYVLTQDGRELLFVGDVAWHMDALRNLHYRPRLVTDFFLDEDRASVLDQFRTLHELLDDPDLQIVVSHDAEQRRDLVRDGVLGDGFE